MIQGYKFLHTIWDIQDAELLTPATDTRMRGHSFKLFKMKTPER